MAHTESEDLIAQTFHVVVGKIVARDMAEGISITPAHARKITESVAISTGKLFGVSPEDVQAASRSIRARGN